MNRIAAAAVACLLLSCACAAQDHSVVKTYSLRPEIVASVADTIRSFIGTNGTVATDEARGRIVVLATDEGHRLIGQLLEGVDTPRNIEIAVTMAERSLETENRSGASASGKIVVTPSGSATRVRLAPELVEKAAGRDSVTRQLLTVADGSEGSLKVGTEVPYADWLVADARRSGYVSSDFQMKHVGASLFVRARIMADGQTISITVTPELSGLVGAKPARIRYTRLSTEVRARDGATISLGGLADGSEFYDKFLTGSVSRGTQRHVEITLTPRITAPRPPPR